MANTDLYRQALELIDSANNVLVTTHTRPDGDACGCVAVLTDALRGLGKTVQPLFLSPVPDWYRFLLDEEIPVLETEAQAHELIGGAWGTFDLIVVADTNSYSQLPRFETYLKQADVPVLVIDHHVTSDGLGRVELVDPTAAAAGLVIYDFLTFHHSEDGGGPVRGGRYRHRMVPVQQHR